MPSTIIAKRIYEPVEESDGTRILVDGIWPRGVRRSEWPKGSWRPDVAPSRQLREWYRHDPDRFDEFVRRYREELDTRESVADLLGVNGHLTLLTATRDLEHSHAAALRDYLEQR